MNTQSLFASAALCALAIASPAVAQDEPVSDDNALNDADSDQEYVMIPDAVRVDRSTILVRADRTDNGLKIDDYTGSATIISREQIVQRQVRDIADVLRDVPGIAVSSVAGQTQLRLRGSEANHVLVLVDGIEVSDPFAGEFDIGTLQTEIGSRVEVLRGPQSALYGSDAIGGVVAYDSGTYSGFGARLEGGSNNTINGAARWGYNLNGFDVSLSATAVSTDGEPNARDGVRDIGRDSYTVSGKIEVPVTDNFALRASARFIRTEGEFNNQNFAVAGPTFGFVVDSPNTSFENEAIYALVGAKLEVADYRWSHDISAQIADITRETFGAFGPSNSSEGDRLKLSYVTSYKLADAHRLTFAADWEREQFRNTTPGGFSFSGQREIENVGLVGEYRYSGEKFDFSAALRHDINDRFADETTFRVGAGYNLTPTTRLRASAGSGIKNPGFFELFGFVDGRFIGNDALQPEKSTSWEVGVDQSLFGDNATVSVTYFDAELEGEIFTTFPAPTFVATPANRTTDSNQSGVEIALAAQLGEQWNLNAAYAYLDADENGVVEVRRPESIASAALSWTAPQDAASATLVIRHNGSTQDVAFLDPSFVPTRVTLDEYTLVNLNARYRLADGLHLFARAENLLDETYEQVFTFVSPGRSVIAGFEATF